MKSACYRINGQRVSRRAFLNHPVAGDLAAGAPAALRSDYDMASTALAVDPRDRKKADEIYRKLGVPTHHDKDGRPHFRSRRHQVAYASVSGYHNHDEILSGTGQMPDPADFIDN